MPGQFVVVEQLYYHEPFSEPVGASTKFVRPTTDEKAPYVRSVKVGESAVKLDTGWVEQAMCVSLENVGKKKLEVSFGHTTVLLIEPGESARFQPIDLQGVEVRADGGETRYTVRVYPR